MLVPSEDVPPWEAVLQMLSASWGSQAIRAMVALGLPEHLSAGPRAISDLAAEISADPPTLARLLRALAGLGMCATDQEGRVRLTARGEVLRSDVPRSLRGFAMSINGPAVERAWHDLDEAVRTGVPTFPRVHGVGFWDYLEAHPEEGALFNAAMSGGAELRARSLLAARDLSGVGTLVDVGGGEGRLLATALLATPGLRGVLFDRPDAVASADAVLGQSGVADRCEVVSGDFFVSVPSGGDAYVLALVIHDWADEEAMAILRTCHRAMTPGARIWLVEQVVKAGDACDRTKLLDLLMLILFGAQERTEAQYRALLQAAGFDQIAVHPTGTAFSVVEGIRS